MRWESGSTGRTGRTGRVSRRWARGGLVWQLVLPVLPVLPALPVLPLAASAQEFVPPREQEGGNASGLRAGILGFGSRVGVDFAAGNQIILSPTLEVADLWTPRIRLRPSVEIGLGDTATTYVMNLELLFRLATDQESFLPYLGFGGAVTRVEHTLRSPTSDFDDHGGGAYVHGGVLWNFGRYAFERGTEVLGSSSR